MKNYFKPQAWRILYVKIMHNAGSPEYNARGVALGLFVGFLVPMGLQLVIALPLAFVCRASKVLAAAFTFVTNHVTILFIYPLQCWVGGYLWFHPISYGEILRDIRSLTAAEDWQAAAAAIGQLGAELLISFFAGGLLFAVIASSVGYVVARKLFCAYQARRAARAAARRQPKANL